MIALRNCHYWYGDYVNMFFRVDQSSGAPIAEQLAVQVRAAVSDGTLVSGDRLPPARELGDALDVHKHTVLRAYAVLRNEGILEMRQGRGAQIRGDVTAGTPRLVELADSLLAEAKRNGIALADVLLLIEKRG